MAYVNTDNHKILESGEFRIQIGNQNVSLNVSSTKIY